MKLKDVGIVIFALGIFSPLFSSWAFVSLEKRLMDADLVVVGELGKTTPGLKVRGMQYDYGFINITKVLKGKKDLKKVKLAFNSPPRKGGMVHSGMITYAKGNKGIWILNRDPQKTFYLANYPGNLEKAGELPEIEKILKSQAEMKWGKEEKGLQILIFEEQPPQGAAKVKNQNKTVTINVYIRNNSGKDLLLNEYVGNRLARFNIHDSNGKKVDYDPYEWHKKADFRKILKIDFHPLRAAQSRSCGSHGAFALSHLKAPGKYKITVTNHYKDDGKKMGLKNVWTGKLVSNTIEVKLK